MIDRKPNRLKGYDYSSDNLYYVTSCVHNMICCFGEVVRTGVGTGRDLSLQNHVDSSVRTGRDLSVPEDSLHSRSDQRQSAKDYDSLPSRSDQRQSGQLQTGHDLSLQREIIEGNPEMMLNEFGKIAKKQWYWIAEHYPYVILHAFVVMPNHIHGIIEINSSKIKRTANSFASQQSIKIKSLSELIGAYKTTVSKQIHASGLADFEWQRSFYEHIIRDDDSYANISDYINNNPKNWLTDKYYKQE